MPNVSHAKRSALIGLRGLVFAANLTDTSSGATYAADLHEVPGIIEAALTANVSEEVLGADDNPTWDIFNALDSIDVELTLGALGTDVESFLLGRTIDSNGVMLAASNDAAPWVAMGFKSMRSDGSFDYMWLYKGKFKASDMSYKSKEKGTVNWQTPKISATFGPRDFDSRIYARVNEKDKTVMPATITSFLTAVYTPGTSGT